MLSRRDLLLGAAALAVAPAVPTPASALTWVPKPLDVIDASRFHAELYFGGARGGGKMALSQLYNRKIDEIIIEHFARAAVDGA